MTGVTNMLRALRNTLKESLVVQTVYRRYVQPHMPQYEPETYIVKGKKFDFCIDIGAHAGTYSILLSRAANRVFAFEPSPRSFRILKALKLPNVTTFNIALGDTRGEAEMSFPRVSGETDYALATLRPLGANDYESVDRRKVAVSQLDLFEQEIDFNRVDFIKIDVEGFEMNVLRGMNNLLGRHKPTLLIEIEERHNPNYHEIFDYLGALGFQPYYTEDGTSLRKLDLDDLPRLQTKERLAADGARKFRAGERKAYLNNFFFLQPSHKSRYLIA